MSLCQSYSFRNTNQSTYDEVVAEEKLQKVMQEYERKSDNSEDETYVSPEQIEEYRMTSRKQILQNRMENSYKKIIHRTPENGPVCSRRHSKRL